MMTVGAARLALVSEAADLILKGGGVLAMAGVARATALKIKMLIVVIPMVITGATLWVFAGFLFMLAVIKLEEAFLTVQKIKGFAEDLGPEAMKTWQPKKLMERMLEVDPQADADATQSFGEEPSLGETPETMQRPNSGCYYSPQEKRDIP